MHISITSSGHTREMPRQTQVVLVNMFDHLMPTLLEISLLQHAKIGIFVRDYVALGCHAVHAAVG